MGHPNAVLCTQAKGHWEKGKKGTLVSIYKVFLPYLSAVVNKLLHSAVKYRVHVCLLVLRIVFSLSGLRSNHFHLAHITSIAAYPVKCCVLLYPGHLSFCGFALLQSHSPPPVRYPHTSPFAVPALRPSVPLPFGSAPPPSALPGFARGTRFELRPRCEASLIPDSFVESNRHLMETLNALPPDDHPPQQQQQQHHRLPGGGPLSWQMPRMPAPMRHPGGSPRKMQHQQQQQQFPYYHRPNPCNVFVPRPPSLIVSALSEHLCSGTEF